MDRPLRVVYLDLGFSKEQYGLQPTRYGGGAVAARHLKEEQDIEFVVFAPREAFDNVGVDEARTRCVVMAPELCDALKRGYPVSEIMGEGKPYAAPDLILHPHTCTTVNRGTYPGPIVHFCGFDGAAGHPGNDYTLLYDPSFTPRFGERAKYVRIGKPVPLTCPQRPRATDSTREQPFVFQCSRHDDHMASVSLAVACRAAGIPVVFAGPIHPGCKLLDHVDGAAVRYLGEVDEQTKLDYCRRAALFSILYAWDPPFSQSVIEAQGQGCPIYVPRRGPFLSTYLHHGVNGFDANLIGLSVAFAAAQQLSPQDSHRAARAYDSTVMVQSFKAAFREIVAEWRPQIQG